MSFPLLVTLQRTLGIGEAEVRDADFFFTTHFVAHFVWTLHVSTGERLVLQEQLSKRRRNKSPRFIGRQ
jgi:hypothetical protein